MDVNIKLNFKQSEINGLFNEIEEIKKQRENLKFAIDAKTETIIKHILENGNVLAYKNNQPHVLTVANRTTKKFDKTQLSVDTGVPANELNLIGVVELVETQQLSSKRLKEYQLEDSNQVLKARKAKKSDIDLLGARAF